MIHPVFATLPLFSAALGLLYDQFRQKKQIPEKYEPWASWYTWIGGSLGMFMVMGTLFYESSSLHQADMPFIYFPLCCEAFLLKFFSNFENQFRTLPILFIEAQDLWGKFGLAMVGLSSIFALARSALKESPRTIFQAWCLGTFVILFFLMPIDWVSRCILLAFIHMWIGWYWRKQAFWYRSLGILWGLGIFLPGPEVIQEITPFIDTSMLFQYKIQQIWAVMMAWMSLNLFPFHRVWTLQAPSLGCCLAFRLWIPCMLIGFFLHFSSVLPENYMSLFLGILAIHGIWNIFGLMFSRTILKTSVFLSVLNPLSLYKRTNCYETGVRLCLTYGMGYMVFSSSFITDGSPTIDLIALVFFLVMWVIASLKGSVTGWLEERITYFEFFAFPGTVSFFLFIFLITHQNVLDISYISYKMIFLYVIIGILWIRAWPGILKQKKFY
jgi:hypothetical protein